MTATEDAAARQAAAGRWLRDQRRMRGFKTVGELARALGVDPSRVSNYETGKNRVPDDRADQIAELFHMNVVDVRRGLRLWVPPAPSEGEEEGDRLDRAWARYRNDPGPRGTVLRGLVDTWDKEDEQEKQDQPDQREAG